jgi:hypothetical protein
MSQTYRSTGVEKTLVYYGQAQCKGEVSWDELGLEGKAEVLKINATFLLVSWEYQFQGLASDGLFVPSIQGLGYPSPLLHSLSLPTETFSLYLSDNSFSTQETLPSSALLLGETASQTYGTGAGMRYVGIVGNEGWVVQLEKVTVGNQAKYYGENMLAVFDAGIGVLLLPPSSFSWLTSVLSAIGNCGLSSSQFFCDCTAFYTLDDYPSLSLSFPSLSVLLTSRQYFYTVNPTQDGSFCVGLFAQGSEENMWVLGSAFMRAYYMEFDQGNARIGLMQAVHAKIIEDNSEGLAWYQLLILIMLCIGLIYMIIMALKLCRISDQPGFLA